MEPCSDPLPIQQPPKTPYPSISYPGPDDDPNTACYKLGYDVGFNKAIDNAMAAVENFAYVAGIKDKQMIISAINALRRK